METYHKMKRENKDVKLADAMKRAAKLKREGRM
jgi:hypothetical protein